MKNGEHDEDEDGGPRVPASRIRVQLADIALNLAAIGVSFGEAARVWDALARDRRPLLATELADELGHLGDAAHDLRRVLSVYASRR